MADADTALMSAPAGLSKYQRPHEEPWRSGRPDANCVDCGETRAKRELPPTKVIPMPFAVSDVPAGQS
jgi:hypothetical protein